MTKPHQNSPKLVCFFFFLSFPPGFPIPSSTLPAPAELTAASSEQSLRKPSPSGLLRGLLSPPCATGTGPRAEEREVPGRAGPLHAQLRSLILRHRHPEAPGPAPPAPPAGLRWHRKDKNPFGDQAQCVPALGTETPDIFRLVALNHKTVFPSCARYTPTEHIHMHTLTCIGAYM